MSEESGAGQRVRVAGDRVGDRLAKLQIEAARLAERVPARVRKALQRVFSLGVLVVIAWVLHGQLEGTDWPKVLRSLPTSPWFYVLFVARFFNLPITETLCYSAVWATSLFRHFGIFLMKYVLNMAVAGATGDVYFLLWAVRTLDMSYRRAFSAVKDVTLLSAAAANAVAVVVLGGYFAFGDHTLVESVQSDAWTIIIAVTLGAAGLSLLLIVFRGAVFGVSTPVMWRIIGYHSVRSGGDLVLLGLQWTVGLPGSSFTDWIGLLIVALLVMRTPFLPAKDFVFLSLALLLAGSIDADQAQVTALFLTATALRQIAFVPSFIAGTLWRSKPHPLPLDPHRAFIDR